MLKIQRTSNGQVVFALSGRMDEEHLAELETLIRAETGGRRIALDLKNLTLAGQEAINFFDRCEAGGITLMNAQPTSVSGSQDNDAEGNTYAEPRCVGIGVTANDGG